MNSDQSHIYVKFLNRNQQSRNQQRGRETEKRDREDEKKEEEKNDSPPTKKVARENNVFKSLLKIIEQIEH